MKRLLLAIVLVLSTAPLAAKELYITVRRDFGPKEVPEIELHYGHTSPFEVRVWRPKDLKEFVTSQVDLRRAWREPAVEANSARYLFAGLNRTRLDLDWLRTASSVEMRKGLMEQLGGSTSTPGATPMAEGPQKLISGPERFTLVTDFVFHPDEEDHRTPFDVPGFDWWFSPEGRLRQKTLRLPKLDAGFYLVQVVQGTLEGQVVLVVGDLTASIQQGDHSAIVRVARRDAKPAAGASVEVRNLRGEWVANGKTDADGVLELSGVKDSELLAVVRDGTNTAIVDTEFFPTTAVFPDLYLYTDRPLYKPGNRVRFRGILRQSEGGVSRLWSDLTGQNRSAKVSLVDLAGAVVVREIDAPISRFGTFSGEFDLGSAKLNGVYRVTARLADAKHVGELRVKDYVKPIFFLKAETDQETLKAGGKLELRVAVERYAGGVPAGVTFGAELFRVRAESPQWIDDAGLSETASAVTYGWDRKAEPVSVAVPYPVASVDDLKFDATGRAVVSLDLPAALPGPRNFDYKFVLRLFAKDPDGNTAALSKSFADVRSEVVAMARMSSVYASPVASAQLRVRAVHPSGKSYGKCRGTVAWTLTPYRKPSVRREVAFTTGDDGRWSVAVPTDSPGRLDAEVTLWDRFDKPTTTEASIVVAPKSPGAPIVDVSEPTLFQEKDSFAPGETARALLLLPDGWGEGGSNKGRIHLTVAGRDIYRRRVMKVDGLSTWVEQPIEGSFGTAAYAIVSYPDPNRGWIERTLTFRIPPRDKALRVSVSAQAPSVKPGQRQALTFKVTDAAGRPVVAELSVSVVDKAVLALQPEFRPGLLAFFYPLDRLGVMSFFSREFQSYGYGERLARRFQPNFWMASTKPDKKNQKDEDTAYWNSKVVTDETGTASVAFRLPGNQTTWSVSAVAADVRGHFGEGAAEFATNAPVTASLAAPTFLRKGDSAQLRVLLSNQDKKARSVKAKVEAPPELSAQSISVDAQLDPGKEASARGSAKLETVAPAGAVTLAARVDSEGESMRFESTVRTLGDTLESVERRSIAPGETIELSAAKGETLRGVRVFATTKFAGTLLPSLRWLMGYPFGCAEQVTSITVPSLLVRDLFGKGKGAQAKGASGLRAVDRFERMFLDPALAASGKPASSASFDEAGTLDSAIEFAPAGLARLATLRNPDGSYGWWTGEKGDPSMTAIVLMLVTTIDDAETVSAIDARRSVGWLATQVPAKDSSLAVTISYVQSRLAKLGIGGSAKPDEATLRFQGEWLASHGNVLDRALWLLAIRNYGLSSNAGYVSLAAPLLADLSKNVLPALDAAPAGDPRTWSPIADDWPRYPGRIGSTLAVAAHALHDYGRLDAVATKKLSSRLLASFDGRHFGSTFETSQVLVHSAWLIRQELDANLKPSPLKLMVGGKTVPAARLRTRPAAGGMEFELDADEALRAPITLEGGDGDLSAHLLVTKDVAIDSAPAVSGGWNLRKEYYRLDAKTGEVLPLGGRVRVGDLVWVRLSFPATKAPASGWGSSYYLLTDQVPAGFSVVEEDKVYDAAPFKLALHGGGYRQRDIRPEQVRWFFAFERNWMNQPFEVGYVLRAGFAGDFTGGVARLEDFYDESLSSRTAARRIGIDPAADSGGR